MSHHVQENKPLGSCSCTGIARTYRYVFQSLRPRTSIGSLLTHLPRSTLRCRADTYSLDALSR